ncbi:amino acid adenylation domain-containing protein/non-ribosomal peptide synthase protein (TIGR01720 family) [Croceifilum oryzae]|uniref:Amino acid adenylation domain-containing protein/non-ribosomal peptide synthase protein (TIGR01720 family) n=1 Tax=Croceifilum oryzae TaxID=1553429 RepID=A0AAJ1TG68_9BACL|nr:non-ribosomal peptide synthetase [Croceifilum oryzae]MDQ0416437.1 amino acid adenylation domain-containing protein/non-ribosomal peptide synthase protein (TIGR01720 family) [Croceifilum oryzae]
MFHKNNVEDMYYLSPMQTGMLYHSLQDTHAYLVQTNFTLRGHVDPTIFSESFQRLMDHHGILRTVFIHKKVARPMQVVLKHREASMEWIDITHLSEEEKGVYTQQVRQRDKEKGFHLSKDPLMRMTVIQTHSDVYQLIWSYHHILVDGWCKDILMGDFFNIYESLLHRKPVELEPSLPYSQYIKWIESQDSEAALDFWRKRLQDYEQKAVVRETNHHLVDGEQKAETLEQLFTIQSDISQRLLSMAKKYQVTLNHVIQSILGVLLQRYNNVQDVVFGSVVSGRPPEIDGVEKILGLFINTVPVRIQANPEQKFSDLISKVHKMDIESKQVEYISLAEIQAHSPLKQNLFEVLYIFQNIPIQTSSEDDQKKEELGFTLHSEDHHDHDQTNYDFTFVAASDQEIKVLITYNASLYDREIIERFMQHFTSVVEQVTINPEMLTADIEMITEEEKTWLLTEGTGTQIPSSKDQTIIDLFEEQVRKCPDQVAVVFEEEELTYQELDHRATQLAHVLRAHGVGRESIVGLMVEKSLEMIVGVFGVLKAGGAYLPIDPSYPEDRIDYMLVDCDVKLLLVQQGIKAPETYRGEVLLIDEASIYDGEPMTLEPINQALDLAYIIYTSGSTGKPKGIMIEHQSVINLSLNAGTYGIKAGERVLQLASISFDSSVGDIFYTLLTGASLYIPSRETMLSGLDLIDWLKRKEITIIHFVPVSFLKQLPHGELPLLHTISTGGEVLTSDVVDVWGVNRTFLNAYGPSETTVDASIGRCNPREMKPSIGKPIVNKQIYILNEDRKLQPMGVSGEIYIGGEGIARGYWKRPDLTAERFVDNPFIPGTKMYRTGDRARWLSDGTIEFMERMDDQVKIRGYRIELGEITNCLLTHPAVKDAVVIARNDEGEVYLCAYLVPQEESVSSGMREYLGKMIPDYMVPAFYVEVDQLPTTPNGKINYRALPAPDLSTYLNESYVAPTNETERKLVSIWQEVLGLERVGTQDHFFARGGHSLKAMMLVSKIQKTFEVDFGLQQVFQSSTLKEMAKWIQGASQSVYAAIPVAQSREYYPVSSAQKRMYVMQQMDLNSSSYNIPTFMRVKGKLDVKRLEEAFCRLIERHESFRTSFVMIEGKLHQKIETEVSFSITQLESTEQEATEWVGKFIRPFNLSQAPLVRVAVIHLAPEESLLLLDMHHIISDGVSTDLLFTELMQLYRGNEVPELRLQYKDYAVWQQEMQESEWMKEQEKYWLETMAGETPVLHLPTDYPRPLTRSFEGSYVEFQLDEETTQKLKQISLNQDTTLYMTLLTLYTTLLHKYSAQEDIIVGSPIAGRPHADLENIMGMFVSTLAMRNYPSGEKTFHQLLQEVKGNTLEAFQHQDYPLEELVEKLSISRDLSRNPLFDTMFAMQNMEMADLTLDGLVLSPYEQESKIAKFDLTLSAAEEGERLLFAFEYDTHLFKEETIERMVDHFLQLIDQVCQYPDRKIGRLNLLTKWEERLATFHDTTVSYHKDQTIVKLFEAKVEKTPEQIAVVYKAESLTYKELDRRSNQLAHTLRAKGVDRETIVGLMVENSVEMIVGALGILKAGGAYLPIDQGYPQARINYMLEDSGTQILLTQRHLVENISIEREIECLTPEQWVQESDEKVKVEGSPTDLAYVIYTSGSTGTPKGVMVEHRSLVNLSCWHVREFGITKADRSAKFASFGFDASVWEIFPYLISGAAIHILPEEIRLDLHELNQYFEQNQITISFLPTQFCEQFMELNNQSLRILLTGGDKLTRYTPQRYKVINNYGPTENTVVTTSFVVSEQMGNIPIGKPIDNVRTYVLNSHQQLQPMGIVGELCVGGDSLARGYLHNPELTAEKFIDNPFVPGEKLYRTGDLVKMLNDGNIVFMGRIDHQVKIRGYRIELGEITSELLSHPSVKEAVVTTRLDSHHQAYLCAYIVSEQEWNAEELKSHLSQNLPSYMIPVAFVSMEEIPLTINGKVDQASLPEPDLSTFGSESYVAPTTETEIRLVSIWREVLGMERIGIEDHFFDLGGHSLKGMTLVSKVQKEFEVDFGLQEVFQAPILKEMAQRIQEASQSIYAAIPVAPSREYYPVSSAQKRMYVIQQMDVDSVSYNMPIPMRIKGNLDIDRLEESICQLIQRHESFRTSFAMIEGEPRQRIAPEVPFSINRVESSEHEAMKMVAEFVRPFNLNQAPLLRATVMKLAPEESLLLLDMHHIISDGVSTDLFFKELMQLYRGDEVPELRIQYKDYAVWQQEMQESEWMREQEKHWLKVMAGEIPVLHLPTDYPRPLIRSFEGANVAFQLGEEATHKLKQLARDQETTLYMTLLTMYTTFLHKYSGQEDIIVGSPIAGRPHADLANIMGMFVNTLAIRNDLSGEKTFYQLLQEVKSHTLEAFKHQDYPLEELVEKLNIPRDLSRNPLFDTMFAMQNMDLAELTLEGLVLSPYEQEDKVAKFDLTLSAVEEGDELWFNFEYDTRLFKQETIERMVDHLIHLMDQVCQHPEREIARLTLLTKQEEETLKSLNDTGVAYPKDQTIVELFTKQAEKTPEQIAVVYQEESLTYKELDQRSNQLAHTLRAKGVRRETIVGLMVDRSVEMIVGVLGILKAGGAYLPIDREYPQARIDYLLEDSGVQILLTQSHLTANRTTGRKVEALAPEQWAQGSNEPLNLDGSPNDLAYVIYTSGSTGNPKGVMVDHQAIIRLVKNTNYLDFSQKHRILQTGSIVFDASTFEIWGSLLNGGELYLIDKDQLLTPQELQSAIERYQITTMWLTAPFFCQLVEQNEEIFAGLRHLLVGGDALSPSHINKVRGKYAGLKIYNGYGPTENTTFSTVYEIKEEHSENIPIGRPITNSTAYVVDSQLQLQPIGVMGELCVGGDGLARGYLNNPELTAEKFIDNPFVSGEKLYRTGDLVKMLDDGNIVFIGRIDHQVKIRGYRVEPGEIARQLVTHQAIQEAYVTVYQEESGQASLCAYVSVDEEMEIAELRRYVKGLLPDYMVPSYFVQMETLPLTVNGKVDRNMLPKPDRSIPSHSYVAPTNEIEEKLVSIWQEVLGIEPISIDQSFYELGGDSIKAVQVAARLNQHSLKLEMKYLLQHPTIQELSNYVKAKKVEISQELVQGEVGLGPIQEWFFERDFADRHHWNQTMMIRYEGRLDPAIIQQVFQKIVEHHDALRMRYRFEDGAVTQINQGLEGEHFTLEVVDLRMESEANVHDQVEQEATRLNGSLDLEKGPLVRLGLIQTKEADHFLMIIHHLVVDGISWRILFEDFVQGYKQVESGQEVAFQPKTHSYQEWASELKKYADSHQIQKQMDYWKGIEHTPTQPLPKDHSSTMTRWADSDAVSIQLSEEETENLLKKVHRAYKTEINDLLLIALGQAFQEWSGENKVLIQLEGHGREEILDGMDINRTIGWFTSAYPVILDMNHSEDFPLQLKTIKEMLRNIPNKGVDYGIIRYMSKEEFEWNLLPEISFNYLGQFDQDRTSETFGFSTLPTGQMFSSHSEKPFSIDVTGSIENGSLSIQFIYSTKQYKNETITSIANSYKTYLLEVMNHCMEKKEIEVTPSDFTSSELSLDELDDVFAVLGKGR